MGRAQFAKSRSPWVGLRCYLNKHNRCFGNLLPIDPIADPTIPWSSSSHLCEVSPTSDKGEGPPLPTLIGMEVGSVGKTNCA